MAAPRFTFVLARHTGEPLGEVQRTIERGLNQRINGVHDARVVMGLDDPLAVEIAPGLSRMRVYREPSPAELLADAKATRVLVHYGELPATMLVKDAAANTLTATFMDPRWVLAEDRYTLGTETYAATDQGDIVWGLIDTQNGRGGGDTWIRKGGVTTGVLRDRTYDRQPVASIIDNLTKVIYGPDVDVDPRDGYTEDPPTRVMANLRVYAQQGSDRPDAQFVYGVGLNSNVTSMTETYLPVRTYATVVGTGDATSGSTVPITGTYGDATGSLYGLHEAYVSDPDLSVQATVDAKASGLVVPNVVPRRVVTIVEPTADAPRALWSYWLGDTISATGKQGAMDFANVPLRVHDIAITIGAEGDERVVLTTAEQV